MQRGSRTGRRVEVTLRAQAAAACLAFALFPACGHDDPSREPTTDIRRSAVTVTPAFVQGNYAVPQTSTATVPVTFNAAQAAGDLNVAIVGWTNNNTAQLTAVVDSRGNAYQLAVGPTVTGTRGAGHLLREEHRRRPGRRQHRDGHVHRRARRTPTSASWSTAASIPPPRWTWRSGGPAPTTAAVRRR